MKLSERILLCLFVYAIPATIAILLFAGCAKFKPVADVTSTRPLAEIGRAVERVDAHADAIENRIVDIPIAHKTIVEFVRDQVAGIKVDTNVVRAELDKAVDNAAAQQQQLTKANSELASVNIDLKSQLASAKSELSAEKRHWLGWRTRNIFPWVAAGAVALWALAGYAGAFMAINPVGKLFGVGEYILDLLPASRRFYNFRDLRRAKLGM